MKKISLIILLINAVFFTYAQTSVQQKITTFCESSNRLRHAHYAISVKDVHNDSSVVSVNDYKSMTSASISKLYTTAAALDYLTPDFTFKTVVGYVGTIHKNVLKGNLIIIGGGDPTLGSKFFPKTKHFLDTIVQAIKEAGITKIDGHIILDCSMYGKEFIPQSWMLEDYGKDYATGVYPLTFNDNIFSITFSAAGNAGDTAKITNISPQKSSPEVASEVILGGNEDLVKVQSKPDEFKKVAAGTLPTYKNNYVVRSAMISPPDAFALELKQALIAEKIVKPNQDYSIKLDPFFKEDLDTITILESPKLEFIVGITNYYSFNSYAEHIIKYLGYYKKNSGTFKAGAEVLQDYFKELQISIYETIIFDGSGLSRFNTTTARQMTEFLNKQYAKGGDTAMFYRTLPISGKPSTLRSYDFPSYMIGKVRAKTGSMSRVRNLAGYMITKSGRKVSFCIMFQGQLPSDGDLKKEMIQILDTVYLHY